MTALQACATSRAGADMHIKAAPDRTAGDFRLGLSGGKGSKIQPRIADDIHPDAITQQCAAGFAPRRIAADDGHVNIFEIMQETQNDFIGQ